MVTSILIYTHNFEVQSTFSTSDFGISDASIRIYPNPAKDFFKIDLPNTLKYKTEIYSTQGQLIKSQVNANVFDVSKLSSGVYVLVISDLGSNRESSEKLVITK